VGTNAAKDGAISAKEHEAWQAEIAALHKAGALFGIIGYFLFTARG
jgi:hypothetical protein